MNTRKYFIIMAAVLCAIVFCILPLEKLQPVKTELNTWTETTAKATTTEARTTTPETTQEETTGTLVRIEPDEVELIARTIYGEARGVKSKAEQAAVAWCILNRVDAGGGTIEEVVTAPNQFQGYSPDGEVPAEFYDLAADVLTRWHMEKAGVEDVGRTLPADYLFFIGFDGRNHFSKEWQAPDFWDWTLKSPY